MFNTKLLLEAKDCAIRLAQVGDMSAENNINNSFLTARNVERNRRATYENIRVSSESRVMSIQSEAVQNEEDIRTLTAERIGSANEDLKVQIFHIQYENNERKKENQKQSEIKVKAMVKKVVNKKNKVNCWGCVCRQ